MILALIEQCNWTVYIARILQEWGCTLICCLLCISGWKEFFFLKSFLLFLSQFFFFINMINIGNRTSCRSIWSVIILVIKQIGVPRFCLSLVWLQTELDFKLLGLKKSILLFHPVTKQFFAFFFFSCIFIAKDCISFIFKWRKISARTGGQSIRPLRTAGHTNTAWRFLSWKIVWITVKINYLLNKWKFEAFYKKSTLNHCNTVTNKNWKANDSWLLWYTNIFQADKWSKISWCCFTHFPPNRKEDFT